MLTVKTPDEALQIIYDRFAPLDSPAEIVDINSAHSRTLHGDIVAGEYVPGFDRSTVDGYAVIAADTFGSSDAIPAVLTLTGEVLMGTSAELTLTPNSCVAVSTGGDLPDGADAVVMLEHTENYGDGLIGVTSPVSPGNNIIFKGDDVTPGTRILTKGTTLLPHDIGILSALGVVEVSVRPRPIIGVISTGDELIDPAETPNRGQVRDVNTPLLAAQARKYGAEVKSYGIIRDEESALRGAVLRSASECDITLISGGSSAGTRDLTARVIESAGELLFHGIAMKPGKPTILGDIGSKPIWGLPGHPVAAYFVTELFVRPLIARLTGAKLNLRTTTAQISEAISSNHGRAEYIAVILDGNTAHPIRGKSGLIASLAGADGYICIPRDSEGIPKGAEIVVMYFG
ncbi:MAG: molybdopterin molybdotransferase MoeA [Oscillospiraceae bacterium]|nr:molybdopterin molybdotransferase MoeA [Oscillospiraceae bacterium]